MKVRRRIKPYRRLTDQMGIRFVAILAVFLIIMTGISVKMIYLVLFKSDAYEKKVLSQQSYSNVEIPYKRGDIYDTNGTTLATSEKYYTVVLEPKNITYSQKKDSEGLTNEDKVVNALVKYLGLSEAEVKKVIADNQNTDQAYYYDKIIDDKLTEKEVKELKEYLKGDGKNLSGIYLTEAYERTYPEVRTACHLLGFLSADQTGVGGLEQYYNSTLSGENGRRYTYLNEELEYDSSITEAQNGKSLVTTVDVNIQKIAEKYLNEIVDN